MYSYKQKEIFLQKQKIDMKKEEIFERLWLDYKTQNPSVEKIHALFEHENEVVLNDHIAFRTFNKSEININVLSKIFLAAGYIEKGTYIFEEKNLFAKHYEHLTDVDAPRVFISELICEKFSDFLQETIEETVAYIPQEMLASEQLIFSGAIWGAPSWEIYTQLRDESEYAAWLYVFGFRANHFTVNVNALKKYNTLEKVNQLLKDNSFILNSTGGEIKGKEEQFLRQSSTKADIIEVEFIEGNYKIPACYYEFAQRYQMPDGKLFSGFIAKSADKIFESTNFYQ